MEVEVPGAGYGFNRALLVFLVLLLTAFSGAGAFVGVNVNFPLGGAGDGAGAGERLPRAEHVVDLLNILQIQQIKLGQDVHPSLLKALSGSGLQVVVTLPEQRIPSLARSREAADDWLREHLLPFLPATNVTGIVVGDRLLSSSAGAVEAMRNVYSSLRLAGLDSRIKVTSSVSSDIISELTTSASELHHFFMHELLGFLAETDSYLMIDVNAYELHLRGEVVPSEAGYPNLVDAALQSAYTAMRKLGYVNVPVVIGSIGWPWKAAAESSSSSSSSASPESAATLNEKLLKHVHKSGADVYIQELLDTSEDVSSARYGLFSNSLAPRYRFDVKTEASDEEESVMRRVLADGTSNGTTPGTSPGTTPGTTPGTGTGGGTGQYCVAKPNTPDNILSVGLNWACGQGNADCTNIQQNGPCYLPDTYASHASYAFNSYYQKNAGAGATCDFNGAAQLVSTDPSYNSCIYTSSTGTSGGGGGGGTGSVGSGPSSNGILQPFNPPGNSSSSAGSLGVNVVLSVILILAAVLWSWRQ